MTMSVYTICFYGLAILIVAATLMAVTRRNLVHTVLYLVLSFFGSGLVFYLLGAPLLAVLEIVVYAGAIMVLFLFVVMMVRIEDHQALTRHLHPLGALVPALVVSLGYLLVWVVLLINDPVTGRPLTPAMAGPAEFGVYLFKSHWLAVEIASLLLLIALIGVLRLKLKRRPATPESDAQKEALS